MGRIVVTEFVSLDGVAEDPGGAEGFEHGGWAFAFDRGDDGYKFKLDELLAADVLLLGRKTYEGFAAAWPSMTDEAGFADKMNGVRKCVVTSTPGELEWNNSERLEGELPEAVARLRDEVGGDVLVAGSLRLVQALVDHDLVDELRLMLFPIVLGKGKRLFAGTSAPKRLRLTAASPVGRDGVMVFRYEPSR